MKNKFMLLLAAFGLAGATAQAQTTIFSESFGTSGGGSALESFSGYDETGVTFESLGGADVRDSLASSGYPGASGGNNVFLADNTEGFYIFGIDYTGYDEFTVSFGGFEGIGSFTGFDDTILDVHYSLDHTSSSSTGTWNQMPIIGVDTGNGWQEEIVSTAATSTGTSSTLALRFTSQGSNSVRIDDVAITAIPEPSSIILMGLTALAAYGILRRRK